MPNAEELARAAKVAEEKANKPLPELRSPMTRLPEETRKIIAQWCRDQNKSFSLKTNELWIAFLKGAKLIAADLVIDLTSQRGVGSFKEKEASYQDEIAKLKEALAVAQKAKK